MHVEFVWTEDQYHKLVEACSTNPMTPYILKHLPKDKPLLEAGCGLANFVKFLTNKSYDVYGIEVSSKAVEIVNTLDPSLKVTCQNIEDIKFPDNYFGGVMCFGVVEHITEGPEKALAELYRVMQPGSIGLISVPVFNTLRKIKHYTGISYADYYIRKFYHKLSNKDMDWLYKDSVKLDKPKYHHWPAAESFFEYRFSKKEFSQKLRGAQFEILEEIPLEGLGGLYFELSGKIVNLSNPSPFIVWLDRQLNKIPFFHHHTYLAIVRKPIL